jgi:hypothetical protein
MPDTEKPKRGLTSEQWAHVRAAYERGESILSLSKRFGVKRDTIAARRDKDCWVIGGVDGAAAGSPIGHMPNREAVRIVREQTQGKVIELASRKAVDQMVEAGAVDQIAADIALAVATHGRLGRKITALLEQYVDFGLGEGPTKQVKNGEKLPIAPNIMPGTNQSHADVIRSLVAAGEGAVHLVREIAGLRPGQPSSSAHSAKNKQQRLVFEDTDAAEIA